MRIEWRNSQNGRSWSALYVDDKFMCTVNRRVDQQYCVIGVRPFYLREHPLGVYNLAEAKDIVVEQMLPLMLLEGN